MSSEYSPDAPEREQVDASEGALVLNFGTNWCGHCRAAEPLIREALANQPGLRHLKIEDGKGRPLGRSFGVKQWPTLIFLRDGEEVGRLVRPQDSRAIEQAASAITAP